MNILFFTLEYHPGKAGGAERQARLQAEELVRRGHHVRVVCPRNGQQRSAMVAGVDVVRLPRISREPFRRISYALVLATWLVFRGRRYDVWHVHLASTQADLVVSVGALLRKPTYVKIASGGETGEIKVFSGLSWLTRRIGLRKATRVQALSAQIVDELRGIDVEGAQVVRLRNGVDLEAFHPADPARKHAVRQKLDLPEDRVIALYTGRFAQYKGLGDLLKAWEDVPETDGVLVLVGERQSEDRPFTMPIKGKAIIARGWSADVIEYLQAADVFVYPSHQDGMSNSLLEAMACGLPPVATAIQAVDGLLQDGRNALLVPPHDPHQLSCALLRLLRDPELRMDIGAAATQTALDYSVVDVVSEIERTYGEITRAC